MATRQQVISRCVELGATFHDNRNPRGTVEVFAPHGKVFASDFHSSHVDLNPSWKRADVYQWLMDDMAGGVEDCGHPDCDWCQEGPGLPAGIDPTDCPVIDGKPNP